MIYPPTATYGPRHLYDYHFAWIIEGDSLAWLDNEKILAKTDTLILCRPGMCDYYEWARQSRTVQAYLHFNFKLPPHWPKISGWPLWRPLLKDDLLKTLFRHILTIHLLAEPQRSNLLHPALELMLRCFISSQNNLNLFVEPYNPLPLPLEKAVKYLHELSLQTPIPPFNMKRLTAAAHITAEHLCRLFRKYLDTTPRTWLQVKRLERANDLLSRSNLTVKEIAETTGFANPYHFSRTFRAHYKSSPRSFSKKAAAAWKNSKNNISMNDKIGYR